MSLDFLSKPINHFLALVLPDWAWLHIVTIFIITLTVAYFFNRIAGSMAPQIANTIIKQADSASTKERFMRVRRLETFISLGAAVGRVMVVAGALILAWRLSNPQTSPIAIISASTIFVVLAGATLVPLLRDITSGVIMIVEHWYNVGDHVVVEPFPKLGGVVEQVTLRSTKLRSVNGEVIWLHNQHIQGVRVTNAASHTLAIETFVNDPVRGEKLINDTIKVIPSGPTTIPEPPMITEIKRIEDNLWRITAICEVTPYREWIIEDFAVGAIRQRNELPETKDVLVHGPIVYYANAAAERRFRRAVQGRERRVRTVAAVRPANH